MKRLIVKFILSFFLILQPILLYAQSNNSLIPPPVPYMQSGLDRDIPEIRDIELKIQARKDYLSVLGYAKSNPDAFAKSCLKGINNPDRPTIGYWEALALSYIIDSNLINQSIRDDVISSSLQALKKADMGRNVFIAAKDIILSREHTKPYPVDPITSVMDIINESDMNEWFAGNILILLGGMGNAVSASNLKVDVVDTLEVISSDFLSLLFSASTLALANIPGNEASDALRRILLDHPYFNDGAAGISIIDVDAGDRDVFDLRQAELVVLLAERGDIETVREFFSSGKGGKLAQNVAAKYLDKPLPYPNYEVFKAIGNIARTVGDIGILLVTGPGTLGIDVTTWAAKSGVVATKNATKLMTAIKSDAIVPFTFNIAGKGGVGLKAAPMVGALNIAKQYKSPKLIVKEYKTSVDRFLSDLVSKYKKMKKGDLIKSVEVWMANIHASGDDLPGLGTGAAPMTVEELFDLSVISYVLGNMAQTVNFVELLRSQETIEKVKPLFETLESLHSEIEEFVMLAELTKRLKPELLEEYEINRLCKEINLFDKGNSLK